MGYIDNKPLLKLLSVLILDDSCNREFKQYLNKISTSNKPIIKFRKRYILPYR